MVSWSVAGRESLLTVAARGIGKWWRVSSHKSILLAQVVMRLVLVLSGLGAVVAAAWVVALPLGLLTLGVALLGFEWWVKR